MLRVAGRNHGECRERWCVVVDPRVAGEVAYSGQAGQQWIAVAGGDGGGEFEETLAPQEGWKRHAGAAPPQCRSLSPFSRICRPSANDAVHSASSTSESASRYRADGIELRARDRIRWSRNDAVLGLVNSRTAEVLSVSKRPRVTFQLEGGKRLQPGGNDPQLRHLDHAWAPTVHAFEGTARSTT